MSIRLKRRKGKLTSVFVFVGCIDVTGGRYELTRLVEVVQSGLFVSPRRVVPSSISQVISPSLGSLHNLTELPIPTDSN